MIGLVLISHSYALAEGTKEMCHTMAGEGLKVAAAGGLDTPDHLTGTDPMRILAAIEEVYSDDGVILFVDMGSALLSAEFAIQMLDEERQKNVRISDAPFVEGAISAAVQAGMNAPLSLVLEELETAMLPKKEQLGTLSPEEKSPHSDSSPRDPEEEKSGQDDGDQPDLCLAFELRNINGLHARPAAKIAALAGTYPKLTISIVNERNHKRVQNARSLNSIALLSAGSGDRVRFEFRGEQSQEAAEALRALAAEGFSDGKAQAAIELRPGEPLPSGDKNAQGKSPSSSLAGSCHQQSGASLKDAKDAPSEALQALPPVLTGLSASAGFAAGSAFHFERDDEDQPLDELSSDPSREETRFHNQLQQLREALQEDAEGSDRKGAGDAAAIFRAQLMMLEDPLLLEAVTDRIKSQGLTAEAAWDQAMRQLEKSYEDCDSRIIRERAKDIRELRRRFFSPRPELSQEVSISGILLADELSPGDVSRVGETGISGICTAYGSPSSHAAVMARSLGIPALMGLGDALFQIQDGTSLVLDASDGKLYIDPEPELAKRLAIKQEKEAKLDLEAAKERFQPAILRNGRQIKVFANIGSLQDAISAVEKGAEGVGLLRTEFIYLSRSEAPGEEEQLAIYRDIAKALDGRPLTIRSLDAGGDKEIPYLDLPKDQNPFLGYRAIRICLEQKELFRTQLRAVLRAAVDYPVRLMFPMISSLSELREAKEELRLAREELKAEGYPLPTSLPVGMMIEIPSAALLAESFAAEADFFSIGTNDLTQYTLAVERGNQKVAHLYSAKHPAVLELIRKTVEGAHGQGIPVAVCGEFASDLEGTEILLGLGVDELSVNPPAIPRLKQRIRNLEIKTCLI